MSPPVGAASAESLWLCLPLVNAGGALFIILPAAYNAAGELTIGLRIKTSDAAMLFSYNEDFMIPVEEGQAVTPGWSAATGFAPAGVTWHWTATWDLRECRDLIGGAAARRKGLASAHYAVGRSFGEGVDRYVSLENRAWHAGPGQTLRWDGRALTDQEYRGSRTTVGVETVNIGYAREGVEAGADWIIAASPDGEQEMLIQPWAEEQVVMMIAVGKEIARRWPHISVRDHHGHHDLCSRYKVDVSGFPFARVLRGIYDDPAIPDVWTPLWTREQRGRVLLALGYEIAAGELGGGWGPSSEAALRRFQRDRGLVEDGCWTTFVCWQSYEALGEMGLGLMEVACGI
jgi:N-acetyl-anhydromuramyl-L-alanine amidase AmpD